MMSASTPFSSSGQYTGAPVWRASGATAPTWSKCVWVSRIASTVSPSSSRPAIRRSASSPGSTTIARREPSAAAKKQFSATGPTVKPWTSTGSVLRLGLGARLRTVEAPVHPAVERVAERHVDHQRDEADDDRLRRRDVVLEQADLGEHEQQGG